MQTACHFLHTRRHIDLGGGGVSCSKAKQASMGKYGPVRAGGCSGVHFCKAAVQARFLQCSGLIGHTHACLCGTPGLAVGHDKHAACVRRSLRPDVLRCPGAATILAMSVSLLKSSGSVGCFANPCISYSSACRPGARVHQRRSNVASTRQCCQPPPGVCQQLGTHLPIPSHHHVAPCRRKPTAHGAQSPQEAHGIVGGGSGGKGVARWAVSSPCACARCSCTLASMCIGAQGACEWHMSPSPTAAAATALSIRGAHTTTMQRGSPGGGDDLGLLRSVSAPLVFGLLISLASKTTQRVTATSDAQHGLALAESHSSRAPRFSFLGFRLC